MPDIFISYARSSEVQAKQVAAALRGLGYKVWRDDDLPPHRPYAEVIEERLQQAKAVIVLWSGAAARSQWVRAEADVARQAGTLVQIALEDLTPPLPFGQIHCVKLLDWSGDTTLHDWRQVIQSIDELLKGRAPARIEPPRPPAPRLSMVVLPFANLSRDPDQEYFVDGITESLTTDLSRLRGSFVIARNTAFSFKGKAMDAKEIGEALNVRYVLEGSVQRGGDRLRLNAQLIDAASGAHIWADRFDKPVADMFDMQDEIVARLARALNAQLIAAEARRSAGAVDVDSMDCFFMGQSVVNEGFGTDEAARARALFKQALELDANNVDALASLAQYDALAIAVAVTKEGDGVTYQGALEYGRRAVALAPNHAVAHLALGQIFSFTDRHSLALAEFQRALELDRNYAHAYAGFAVTSMYAGQPEAVEERILQAFRLSPHDHQGYLWCQIAGMAMLCMERDADAETWLRRGMEINRAYPLQVLYLAASLVGQGRLSEAKATAQEALTLNPRFTVALLKSLRRSTNPTFVRQLGRVLENLKTAGIPAG